VELILALDIKPPFRKGASALDNVPDALVLKSSPPSELSESSKSDRFAGFVSLSTTRLASFLSSFNGDGNGEVTTGLTTTVVVSLGS
jgi:hypothetical protein